tara:strand:+ start:1910 stop:2101 length:192 start_codon:yes stop_codon:yes gene_type:complete
MEPHNIKANLQWLKMAEMNVTASKLAEDPEDANLFTKEVSRLRAKLNKVKSSDFKKYCIDYSF